jgi:hypothetical protein
MVMDDDVLVDRTLLVFLGKAAKARSAMTDHPLSTVAGPGA